MGPFESQVSLVERVTDQVIRKQAAHAFWELHKWFERIQSSFYRYFGNPQEGFFGIDLRRHNKADWFPGQLQFTTTYHRSARPNVTAGFATGPGKVPIIRFFENRTPADFQEAFPRHLADWWRLRLKDFVHEYTHWYDKARRKDKPSATSSLSLKDYVNSPEEMQATFIETTMFFFDWVRIYHNQLRKPMAGLKPAVLRRTIFGNTFREFLQRFTKQYQGWGLLTPSNQRRLIKRLAGTWEELNAEIDRD